MSSFVLESWKVVVLHLFFGFFLRWRRSEDHSGFGFCLTFVLLVDLASDSQQIFGIFSFEIGDEGRSSFGFRFGETFFELMILWFNKHVNLILRLLLEVCLFFRTIEGGMTSFAANSTFHSCILFGFEGTGPSSMTLSITILAVVIINSLKLHVVTFHKLFHLLIFFPIQNLFNFFNTFIQLFIIFGNNEDV